MKAEAQAVESPIASGVTARHDVLQCASLPCAGLFPQRQGAINAALPLPVIAGITQAEGTALGAQATVGQAPPSLNIAVHGCVLSDGASPRCRRRSRLLRPHGCRPPHNTLPCELPERCYTWQI